MRTGGRGLIGSHDRFSTQRLAVVVQVSVSLVLLVSALLFVRSFRNLVTFDPGMRESGLTNAWIGFGSSHVDPDHYAEFGQGLLEEIASVPGVQDAATTTLTPLVGGSWEHGIQVGKTHGNSKFTWISPTYFKTMGISLLKGRNFNENDTANSPHVVIVNQTFSRQLMNGVDPLGQSLQTMPEPNYPSAVFQIVGVIPDTKYNDIREATPPMAFAPASQYPVKARGPWTMMMIRSNSPATVGAAIKRAMARNHPEIVMQFWDFQEQIHDRLVRERLMALLASIFGVLAAVLVATGLYGVLAYIVASRRNEIGIRIALGASRSRVIWLVMRDAGWMLIVGIVLGTGLSLLAGRAASSMLFGLKPYDPMTLAFAAGLMGAIAALASFVPARRAAALDAMQALREE
jgi:predicted permease